MFFENKIQWMILYLKKKDCIKWLTGHGLSTSGTLDELPIRINIFKLFKLYPSLTEKLKRKAERIFVLKLFWILQISRL